VRVRGVRAIVFISKIRIAADPGSSPIGFFQAYLARGGTIETKREEGCFIRPTTNADGRRITTIEK
jgi:hypothetical protein